MGQVFSYRREWNGLAGGVLPCREEDPYWVSRFMANMAKGGSFGGKWVLANGQTPGRLESGEECAFAGFHIDVG